MARDAAVDEFVNCVIRRGDQDMILKPSLMIVSLIIPILLGLVLSIAVLITHSPEVFPEEEMLNSITIVTLTAALMEFAVLSFMTFCISRRNWNHLKRDLVWMDALCDFISSRGGDVRKMRDIEAGSKGRVLSTATRISMAIWLVFIIMLVIEGAILHLSDPILDESILGVEVWVAVFLIIGFFIALVQLILTVGAIFGMPARHDKIQAEFTKEFVKEASKLGLYVEPMAHNVKRRVIWIHVILMIVTLGLYSFVYFIIACRDMNKHIHTQWKYEERLTSDLIRFVGGNGIESTEEGMPNDILRLLNNLM